jgi:outer membrane protein OmpA-like peptidoglycan-associated protein
MAFNLLETVRGYITPDLIEKASSHLGESSSGITKATTAAVPALLAMFTTRAEKGDAHGLLQDAQDAANSNVLTNPQSLFSAGTVGLLSGGIEKLMGMFGGNVSSIISAIANFAGIKSGSVQGLLGMLAPLGLGALGKHVKENNLTAQGLTSFLSGQKASILSALPAGLSLSSLFDGDRKSTPLTTSSGEVRQAHAVTREVKKTNWIPWLLLALGIVVLLWLFGRKGCNEAGTANTDSDTTAVISAPTVDNTAPTGAPSSNREITKVRLADGTEINAYGGGVEDQLVKCLDDNSCTAGKDKWYDFDNLNFETGSAKLTSESQAQVQNIVAILKAYPKAKIKIGGYTDKTGDAAANIKLSQQRAEAVLKAIQSSGANAGQLSGAEGYGSEFAKVAADASDEERRSDRRIAVQLREK